MTPKAEIKPEKKDYLANLADTFKNAGSVTFVDYTGMDVSSQQGLKAKLKDSGSRMFVAKNTLINLAGTKANLPEEVIDSQILSGQTAVVISGDDPVSPIQTLGEFTKDSETLKFKAGVVEGVFQNKDSLLAISKLPGRDQLLANAMGAIAAPMYALVGTLEGNLQKLVFMLSEYAKTKPEATA